MNLRANFWGLHYFLADVCIWHLMVFKGPQSRYLRGRWEGSVHTYHLKAVLDLAWNDFRSSLVLGFRFGALRPSHLRSHLYVHHAPNASSSIASIHRVHGTHRLHAGHRIHSSIASSCPRVVHCIHRLHCVHRIHRIASIFAFAVFDGWESSWASWETKILFMNFGLG